MIYCTYNEPLTELRKEMFRGGPGTECNRTGVEKGTGARLDRGDHFYV